MFEHTWKNTKYVLKELFKDFKFTVIKLEPGNEMIRTSWFGRHDYVPYIRLDLWSIGFRISYDPDYHKLFWESYFDRLDSKQVKWVRNHIEIRLFNTDNKKTIEVARGGNIIREPVGMWRDLCKTLEDKEWV